MKHKAKRAASLALGLGLALQLGTAASAQGVPTSGYENGTAALNLSSASTSAFTSISVPVSSSTWAPAVRPARGIAASLPLWPLMA